MTTQIENPWDVESVFDYLFFNCPTCFYKSSLKQNFVNHSFHTHPESIDYFKKISDNSLNDIILPKSNEKIAQTYGDLFFDLREKSMHPSDQNYSNCIMNWIKANVFQKATLTMTETEYAEKFSKSFKKQVCAYSKAGIKIKYGLSLKIDQFLNQIIDVGIESKIQEINQQKLTEEKIKPDFDQEIADVKMSIENESDDDESQTAGGGGDNEYSVEKLSINSAVLIMAKLNI